MAWFDGEPEELEVGSHFDWGDLPTNDDPEDVIPGVYDEADGPPNPRRRG